MNRVTVDRGREQAELERYLGSEYDHSRLQRYEHTLEREFSEHDGSEEEFYRTSRGYLYNLTAFAMSGTKEPYLGLLTRHLEPGARILDYGCGIGSDGLALLEAGYRVEFADFDNPSVAYLRWRLGQRGLDAPIHDLDRGVPGGFDAAFSFDVIEHVPDAFAFLGELEQRAGLVAVNFLEPEEGEYEFHHELPIRELVDRAAARALREYVVMHGRSHLVVYSSAQVGVLAGLRNRGRVAAKRLRRRLRRPLPASGRQGVR